MVSQANPFSSCGTYSPAATEDRSEEARTHVPAPGPRPCAVAGEEEEPSIAHTVLSFSSSHGGLVNHPR